MRTLAILFTWAATAVTAAAPQTGIWWSPAESGRGYTIDVQNDTLVLISFLYGPDGRMQWYYSDGKLTNDGASWTGTLLKFDQGQPLGGAYKAPIASGNDGAVSITFSSRTTGVITLPGGRTAAIEHQNFGVGAPPQSLLGSWLYVYAVGNDTFAARFNYTAVGAATRTGTGVVVDTVRNGGAEYMVSGDFAGQVVAVQFDAAGNPLQTYFWNPYLEEGRGFWISPTTQVLYGMNAYRFVGPSGMVKGLGAMIGPDAASREGIAVTMPKAVPMQEYAARNPALGAIAAGILGEVRKAGAPRR